METQLISEDRQTSIRLMVACGWEHRREGKYHYFRGDGCSLHGYDVAKVSHNNLSTAWALRHCAHPELYRRVERVKRDWLNEFLAAYAAPIAEGER